MDEAGFMAMAVNTANNRSITPLALNDLVRTYEVSNQAESKSPKTVSWYTEMLEMFLSYLAANGYSRTLESFTVDIVRNYILHLRERPKFRHHYSSRSVTLLSLKTVQCHARVLKAFSSWLHSEGYTEVNCLKNLKLPKAPVTIIDPLTSEEIKRIIASTRRDKYYGVRNHVLFVLMLDTGLRASEAAGITLAKLNLEDGFIKVQGKGNKERIVPIGNHVRMILFSYVDKVRANHASLDCDNLFLSRSGRSMNANAVKMMFSRLAKLSGVKRLHAHLCRHTFATNYLLNGGDIFSLKEILGHTTFEMVNHYLHFTSSQITEHHHKFSPMDRFYKIGTNKNLDQGSAFI